MSATSPRTLPAWFAKRAMFSKEEPALTFEGRTWTYRELHERSSRLAGGLQRLGVKKGDRVGYLGFNSPDVLVILFAATSLGAIFLPLNYRLTPAELQYIIRDADIHTLIVANEHLALIEPLRETRSIDCRSFVHLDGPRAGWTALEGLLEGDPIANHATVDPGDVATIVYTSGTTGRPKGAMLSHSNLWANNLNWILSFGITSRDVLLTSAPMFHVSGLFVLLTAVLQVGGHVVLHRAFEPGAVLHALEKHRITITFVVPTMILAMSQHPTFDAVELGSLRSVIVGGAPTPESLLRLCAKRGIPISHNYGMTETVTASTFLETGLAIEKVGSAGRAMMLSEISLIDSAGVVITAPHVKGEIRLRGDNVALGYWNKPEATAEAFSKDGWYRSGDVGYLDEDGFLYVCDRVKDMIISGGENIYPAEIESVLLEHPAVASAAVVGVPDERWGEHVVAVIVLRPGADLTLQHVQEHCAPVLARYKLPRELRILEQLPLNGAGKVVKQTLRQMLTTRKDDRQ